MNSTAYDARCRAILHPDISAPSDLRWRDSPWQDINTTAELSSDFRNRSLCPGFEVQSDPRATFRPGQIFAAQITSGFMLHNFRTFRDIDFGDLPLEPIPTLKATSEDEQVEDRSRRLAQIRELPLEKMTRYCEDAAGGGGTVHCLLCWRPGEPHKWQKEKWASDHFRHMHWQYYFGMTPEIPTRLSREKKAEVIAWEKQNTELSQPSAREFSAEKWITLEDVTLDIPIEDDYEMVSKIQHHSKAFPWPLPGPIMIQRFVVVREGNERCLALGIHTLVKPRA